MTETRPERKLREVSICGNRKPITELFDFICPDCGCKIDKPNYSRENAYADGRHVMSTIHIECPICGFRTGNYGTVKGCYDEWNKREL